jgi:CHAT domain-containing protein/predicted negative regulator of RcsB-dependent stress response
MEQQSLLQEFNRASDAGQPDGDPLFDREIDLPFIELLKKEVDHCIRSDTHQALRRADLLHRLSSRSADPLARALGARTKAQALHVHCRYAETIELYEKARAIYREQGKPVDAARIERAMVDALMYLSRYAEALAIADDARETFLAHGEDLLAAQLETNVGNIYHRLDQYQEALRCYKRAGEVFSSANDLTSLAVATFNSANILSNLDDFRQARALYEQAYGLHRATGMELAAAQVRYSLGYLHFLKGEYHPAMRVLHEVREESARLEDERMTALCELDLSEIYLQMNVYDEAASLAERARARFRRLGMRYEAAKALTYQGLTALHRDELAEAEQLLRAARAEFAEEGNAVCLGLNCIYLAELSLRRREPTTAFALADQAQEYFSRQHLRAKTLYAQLIAAKALMLGGDQDRAKENCEAILDACGTNAGEKGAGGKLEAPWLTYQVHELLGDALCQAGDLQEAHRQYRQAIVLVEQVRAGIRVDEFRSAFFKDKLKVYEKMIQVCLEQETPEGQAEAFYYLESRKGRTLADMLANELEAAPAAEREDQQALYQQWSQLREELHWYANKTSQAEANGIRRLSPLDDRMAEEIRRREQALVELSRQAQLQDPHFVWLRDSAGLTVAELREALAEDEAVIEYYLDAEELKIFIVDQNSLQVVESAYSREELEALISDLRFQLEKSHSTHSAARQESLLVGAKGCLRELYWALFAPAASLVEGKKLIFIPFDLLHNVPFQALYDGESYLLDRFEIACAPSARLFLLAVRRGLNGSGESRALIFGIPDDAAPHIAEEIRAIHQLFPDAHYFAGADATSNALARHMPASSLVHIACHAVFRQDNPMFSAFKLADAWLNFYDVCSMRTRGALVVLSGCSTGVGGVYVGDEMLGLVRGFLYANAASLVVSLWAVNDPATTELMKGFYKLLREGRRPRAALREAALRLKQQQPHPYYWAPFVMIGSNEAIFASD